MATSTPNYKLPLYEGTDKPNLLDQYNGAISTIDTQLKTVSDNITAANNNISTMRPKVDQASTDASAAKTASDANTKAIAGKAPTMHADPSTTYGVGTASNYGHVKLSDAVSDGDASGAAAASTYAVAKYTQTQITNLKTQLLNMGIQRVASKAVSFAGADSHMTQGAGNVVVGWNELASQYTVEFFGTTQFVRDGAGMTESQTIIYTLPAEHRPSTGVNIVLDAACLHGNGGTCVLRCYISTNGDMKLRFTADAAETGISMSGSGVYTYFPQGA